MRHVIILLVFSLSWLTPDLVRADNTFVVTNKSGRPIWCAIMYYVPKDSNNVNRRRNESYWHIKGWWEIQPGHSARLYSGEQQSIFIHIRSRCGSTIVPRKYDDCERYPVTLDNMFKTSVYNSYIGAVVKEEDGPGWSGTTYRNLGALLDLRAPKWTSVRFYKVSTSRELQVP